MVYLQFSAPCHQLDGKGAPPYLLALAGNPAVLDRDPISLINITLNGSSPVVVGGSPDAYRMNPFRSLLGDQDVAELVGYIRSAWRNRAARVTQGQVSDLRSKTDPVHDEQLMLLRMR